MGKNLGLNCFDFRLGENQWLVDGSYDKLVEQYEAEGFTDDDGNVVIEDIPIGDGTTEEMCVAVVGILVNAD